MWDDLVQLLELVLERVYLLRDRYEEHGREPVKLILLKHPDADDESLDPGPEE